MGCSGQIFSSNFSVHTFSSRKKYIILVSISLVIFSLKNRKSQSVVIWENYFLTLFAMFFSQCSATFGDTQRFARFGESSFQQHPRNYCILKQRARQSVMFWLQMDPVIHEVQIHFKEEIRNILICYCFDTP